MTDLLPPNSTRVERSISLATARASALPVPLAQLWTPETCPEIALPWLAWALSVDEWDPEWSEAVKRAVIRASVEVHRRKGTRFSILRALEAAGYGDAEVVEAWQLPRLGRPAPTGRGMPLGRDWVLGWCNTSWADYHVTIHLPISRRAADALRRLLSSVAPVRCRLRRIILAEGARHVLGSGVWTLGNETPLGGVYNYEVPVEW